MNRTALITSILVLTATSPAFAQARRGGSHSRASSAPPTDASSASPAPADAAASAAATDSSAAPASAAPASTEAVAAPSDTATAAAAPAVTEVTTPPPAATPPPPEPTPVAVAPVEEHPVKFLAVEVGPVIGLNIATNRLGLGPDLGLELGVRLHLGTGFFAVHVRGAYERYTTSGTGTLACNRMPADGAPTDPCVNTGGTGGSMYSWSLLEETVTLGLPLSYRLFDHSRFHPYVHVQPQLVMERAQPTTYNLTNTETAMRFGILGALGAQYDIGPGAVWLEAGYRWTPVNHLSTGSSTIGVVALAIGYRFAF